MQIESAHSPKWVTAGHTAINVVVKFKEISTEIPFTASATDIELHGRELFTRALAGDFGDIEEPVLQSQPRPVSAEELERNVRQERAILLQTSDKYTLTDFPITDEKRVEWLEYRRQLRDLTDQPGFPESISWPVQPK